MIVKNKTKVKSKKAKVVSDGEPDEMQEMIDKAKSKRKKKKFKKHLKREGSNTGHKRESC